MSLSKLFQPIKVGQLDLKHRVVLAPLTRSRANDAHVPSPLAAEYYAQRASVPGTLLIAEATLISREAGGYANVPGIYTSDQIAAWKKITDAVHAKGSYIFLQIWAAGRAVDPSFFEKQDPPLSYVSASDVKISTMNISPRPLTIPEIRDYIDAFRTAAGNAVNKAGFDGVEVHGANGFLLEQFLKEFTNKRTDEYGGSIRGRSKFVLEVVDAVVEAVGEKKTGIRLSPWNTYMEMSATDSVPTYSYVIAELRKRHPDLAYIHAIEPRIEGISEGPTVPNGASNDFIRELWHEKRLITNAGYTRESGMQIANEKGDLIAYGRPFIANPDLPFRLQKNIALTIGDRNTYYGNGSQDPIGYTSYPFAEQFKAVLIGNEIQSNM